jgi:hypothetical protein
MAIDLHHGLPQLALDPGVAWPVLRNHLTTIEVAGDSVTTLDAPASALLAALHAAHHGPTWSRALEDLERAATALDLSCWHEARRLADALNAAPTLGVGLGLTPASAALAPLLGLDAEPTSAIKVLWAGGSWTSGLLEALAESPGQRWAIVRGAVLPSAAAMRRGSALARRGSIGLAAAYAVRLARLARGLIPAVHRWRADRRRLHTD